MDHQLGFIATRLGMEKFDARTGKKIGEVDLDVLFLTCMSCGEQLGPGTRDTMRAAASQHYVEKHDGKSEHGFAEYPIPDEPIEEGA